MPSVYLEVLGQGEDSVTAVLNVSADSLALVSRGRTLEVSGFQARALAVLIQHWLPWPAVADPPLQS